MDLGAWPAASAHLNTYEFFAPSIDLACEFVNVDPGEWLYVHCDAPAAANGLVSSHTNVFAEDGRLVAAGTSQLLFKEILR